MNDINTLEGLIEAHTQGTTASLAGRVGRARARQSSQRRFDAIGLPRDAKLSFRVL